MAVWPEGPWTARLASEETLSPTTVALLHRDIDAQVDRRVAQHLQTRKVTLGGLGMPLSMVGSLGLGAAVTGAAGSAGGPLGVVVVWASLVLVNVAWALAWARQRS